VLAEHIRPLFEELPAALDNTREGSNELSTAEILSRFARKGLLDLDLLRPTSSSVSARDLRRVATILACLAEHSGTLASIYMVNAILAPAVIAMEGTAEQKQRLLPKIQAGILQLAFALTEPESRFSCWQLNYDSHTGKRRLRSPGREALHDRRRHRELGHRRGPSGGDVVETSLWAVSSSQECSRPEHPTARKAFGQPSRFLPFDS
jgi:hypothetical protein